MIAYIQGLVTFIEANHAVVLVGGVGYQILLGKKDLDVIRENSEASFFVHTHVREDALDLYGFQSRDHKQIFLMLLNVSGIGPKLALTILSHISPYDLLSAVINKDLALLSSIPGIGKKTAERLSLELKEKALKMDLSPVESSGKDDAKTSLVQAIRSLGYSKAQSDRALSSLAPHDLDLPLDALIKKTLTILSGA